MPANITVNNGVAEMMTADGRDAWHGLGARLSQVATAQEAIEAANMGWEVGMREVFIQTPSGQFMEVTDKKAVTRMDNGKVFGVFSNQYTPLQNRDAFTFFDSVVGAGEAIYHTAGTLAGGSRIWILAKLPGDLKLSDTDVLERYILLANSHDGSLAVTMKPTTVRVVCNNTLSVALGGETNKLFRAVHTSSVMQRVNQARETLGLQEAYFANVMRGIERLADERMTQAAANEFLVELFGQEENREAISTRMQNQIDTVGNLFVKGTGNHGVNRWDMLNAVTEFVDHKRTKDDDKRLDAAWFGGGKDLKQKAWNLLLPAGTLS